MHNMFLKYRRFSVLGAHGVGKTAIVAQMVTGTFELDYFSSITRTHTVNTIVHDSKYNVDLIDTAGQYEFSLVPADCCFNIDGWILVYSVTSEKSFEIVQSIYKQLLHQTGLIGLVPIVLVANKVDLAESRVITSKEGSDLAKKWGANYIESSAQCNLNISEIFTSIVTQVEKRNTPEKKKKRRRRPSIFSCMP